MAGFTTYAAPTMTTLAAPTTTTLAAPVTTMAAPTMTTMAAPVTTMAAPTTTVAAPITTYAAAAPTMTTVAAPAYTAAAPVVTTQAPSFVAAPTPVATMTMPAALPVMPGVPGIPVPAPPAQPVKLTEGIPDPAQIAAQKAGYAAALDKQLKEAMETVTKETQIEKEMVKFTAEKNIALFNMQIDEKLVESLALADEQATISGCELKKALVERNLALNTQAQSLLMDYNMKALVTECEGKKYAFAQQYAKAEGALEQQYAGQVAKAATGTAYAAPAAVAK